MKLTTERSTDAYIIIMLLIFPLFFGFSGYRNITASKFVFFLVCTGLWAASLTVPLLRGKARFPFAAPQRAALAYLLLCFISWLCSPNRAVALLGAGRYDGLVSTFGYVLIFLCTAAFARPRPLYVQCFALAVSLCAGLSLMQLAGLDLLHLYPNGLTYYDSGIKYTGAFLGTVGNTNLLDTLLCLALPLFCVLYVCGQGTWSLPPVLLSLPVLCKAGGDGGKLALALTLLTAMPLLLTQPQRIRRALRCGAYISLSVAFSLCWQPTAGAGWNFLSSSRALWLTATAVLLLILAHLPEPRRCPSPRTLRCAFLCISLLLLLGGFAAAYFAGPEDGARYELGQILHGQAEDSFGSSRIQIWRACLPLIKERPLLGGGPGTAALRLDIVFSRHVPETGETLRTFVDNCHNVYLSVLLNSGCLALAALLIFGALIAYTCYRRREAPLTLPLGLGVLGCAIQEFFGLGLCITMPLLWIFLGLICASRR